MTTVAKKEHNSDLYENEDRVSQGTYSFVADPGNRAGFDRARWSEQDMELLFRWFDDPINHRRYKQGIKVKAMRALAETIPGKTDRQVQNKMTALENHYNQCKSKLKQGIPLTERDVESGITTAPAKVKSIFRYYYEMDHILNGQSENSSSRNDDTNEYESPSRNYGFSRSSYPENSAPYSPNPPHSDRGREFFPHKEYNGDKSHKPSSNHSSHRHYQPEGPGPREPLPSINLLQEGNSPLSTNSLQRHTSDRTPRHPSESNSTMPPLPSRNSDPASHTPVIRHSVGHFNFEDKPGPTFNSDVRIVHSSNRSGSRKERLLRLQEDKLALKRKRHAEAMEFANRQLEAEERWRRQSHADIQEDLALRRQELQLRQEELALHQARLNQGPLIMESDGSHSNTELPPTEPLTHFPVARHGRITLDHVTGSQEA